MPGALLFEGRPAKHLGALRPETLTSYWNRTFEPVTPLVRRTFSFPFCAEDLAYKWVLGLKFISYPPGESPKGRPRHRTRVTGSRGALESPGVLASPAYGRMGRGVWRAYERAHIPVGVGVLRYNIVRANTTHASAIRTNATSVVGREGGGRLKTLVPVRIYK